MLENLVVGNTSQLAHYFPDDYTKISSREIFPHVYTKRYNRVYLCLGVSKRGLKASYYNAVNVSYTLELVKKFSPSLRPDSSGKLSREILANISRSWVLGKTMLRAARTALQ